MSKDGIFLAVEGIDGAGKTTQVQLLEDRLRAAGMDVVRSKEPTNGKWGTLLRESASSGRLPLDEEVEAFVADRREHLEALVLPGLAAGKTVILDRYYYSTIAYQGARGGDVPGLLARMNEFAPVPDLVFLIDLEPSVAVSRITQGRGETPNQFERKEYLEEVREIFNWLAQRDEAILKLDGQRSIADLHAEVVAAFIDGPLKRRKCFKSYDCDLWYCSARIAGECNWAELQERIRHAGTVLAAF